MNPQATEQPPSPNHRAQALANALHDTRVWYHDLRRNGVTLTPTEFAADVLDRLESDGYQLITAQDIRDALGLDGDQ